MTPSKWLASNLTDVIVAVSQAQATLAGWPASDVLQANPTRQEGAGDE